MKKKKTKQKQRMQESFANLRNFRNPCKKFFVGPYFQNWYQTSIGHNFFVRTPIRAFLDSTESSLSLESNICHLMTIGSQIFSKKIDCSTKCTNYLVVLVFKLSFPFPNPPKCK